MKSFANLNVVGDVLIMHISFCSFVKFQFIISGSTSNANGPWKLWIIVVCKTGIGEVGVQDISVDMQLQIKKNLSSPIFFSVI